MKRYTKEFINDEIRKYKACENQEAVKQQIKLCNKALGLCEIGAISDFEAIRGVINVYNQYQETFINPI